MKLSRILGINCVAIILMFGLSFGTWLQLPPNTQVPVHFDLAGNPDGYMGKIGLLLMPGFASIITLFYLILPHIEPNRDNLKRSETAYTAFSIAITLFLAIIHVAMLLFTLGKAVNIASIVTISLGGLLMVAGNYLSKIRRNHSFGFRTPWTLCSNLAWHKTHRLASWLTVLHGLLFVVAGWQGSSSLLVLTLISFVTMTMIILPVYSYVLWKSDPNRIVK